MHVIFLGPPACGKGTQSKFLVEKFGYKHLSTGDLIRAEVTSDSDIGKVLKSTISTGSLVEDSIVNQLVQNYIDNCAGMSVLFDGYPRTMEQALFVDSMMDKKDMKIKRVFYFDIDPEELVKRVVNRVSCNSCGSVYNLITNPTKVEGVCDSCGSKEFSRRSDDSETVLQNRIKSYFSETKPLKDFYESKGLLSVIDARLPVDVVTQKIINAL